MINNLSVDNILFDIDKYSAALPPNEPGLVFYDPSTFGISTYVSSSVPKINLGQQLVLKCVNNQGSTLERGKIVHIAGVGNGDYPKIKLADWSDDNNSANTLGLVMHQIGNGSEGYVLVAGQLEGVNTSGYSLGQVLYLSSSGTLTSVKPEAPYHTVTIGQVSRTHSINGRIYVSVQNGYELSELHDVNAHYPSNGDILYYNNGLWINSKNLTGNFVVTGSINTIGTITSSNGVYVPQFDVGTGDPIISEMVVRRAIEAEQVAGSDNFAKLDSSGLSGNNFSGFRNKFETEITGTENVLFHKNIKVLGTASVAHLESVNQSSLNIGEKYIVIVSGSTTETDLDEAGILWGSGSNLGTPNGEYAFLRYDIDHSHLHAYPGLYVSGSITASQNISASSFYGNGTGLYGLSTSSIANFSGSVRGLFAGSNGINLNNSSGAITLSGTGQLTALSASSHVSASTYYGDGSNLANVTATNASVLITTYTNPPVSGTAPSAKEIVAISGSALCEASNNDSYKSNVFGVVINKPGSNYIIATHGDVQVNGAAGINPGELLYVGTNGACTTYDNIPVGNYITQVGIKSINGGTAGEYVILQPRIFGIKG